MAHATCPAVRPTDPGRRLPGRGGPRGPGRHRPARLRLLRRRRPASRPLHPDGRARRTRRGPPTGRLSGRVDHRRNRRVRPHRPGRLVGADPEGPRDAQRRTGHPARRLLPRLLHHQHHPRLEPRRAVRDPAARPLERRPGDRRIAGSPQAVRQRPGLRRLGARPRLRLRRHRQGQHRRRLPPRRRRTRRRPHRMEHPRHPTRPSRTGGDHAALSAARVPHPRDGHVQRRLSGALAVGEPPRAVRRRCRLGGHSLAYEGPQPAHLPAAHPARLPHLPGRWRGQPARRTGRS